MILNHNDKALIVNALDSVLTLAVATVMYNHDVDKTEDNTGKVTDAVCDFVQEYLMDEC